MRGAGAFGIRCGELARSRESDWLSLVKILILDLERRNAAVLLHDAEVGGTNLSAMTDALERTLQALPGRLPVVVVGLVPAATLRDGSFELRSLHGRWPRPHTELARRFPGVYATSYVTPELIGQVRCGAVVLGVLLLSRARASADLKPYVCVCVCVKPHVSSQTPWSRFSRD